MLINGLCPVFSPIASMDPSLIVLCLNDKDSGLGNNDMVNLAATEFSVQYEVIEDVVLVSRKATENATDFRFAHSPLEMDPCIANTSAEEKYCSQEKQEENQRDWIAHRRISFFRKQEQYWPMAHNVRL